MSVQPLSKCAKLPRPEVSGQQQYATALPRCVQVVFQPFIPDNPLDSGSGVLWKLREFAEQIPETVEEPYENTAPGRFRKVRQRNFQIACASPPEITRDQVGGASESPSNQACCTARQQSESFEQEPCRQKFDEVTKRASLLCTHGVNLAFHRRPSQRTPDRRSLGRPDPSSDNK